MSEPDGFYFKNHYPPRINPCIRCGGEAEALTERRWLASRREGGRGENVYIRCEAFGCRFSVSYEDVIGDVRDLSDIDKLEVVVSFWNREDYTIREITKAEHEAFRRWHLNNDRASYDSHKVNGGRVVVE